MKIAYFGDGEWAHNSFKAILALPGVDIALCCARFPRGDLTLRELALDNRIPYLVEESVNSPHFVEYLRRLGIDLIVSMSFDQILHADLLATAQLGAINCHAGLLPSYRGRNVLNWVLINDEKEFGITVHFIDQGIDTGDIILQERYAITDRDDYASLLSLAYRECPRLLISALKKFLSGDVARTPQSEIDTPVSYCKRRKAGDELIRWNAKSREIFNFVRALRHPGPTARTFCQHGHEALILRVEMLDEYVAYPAPCGAVIEINNDFIIVKTIDSSIKVTEWMYPNTITLNTIFR